MAARADILGLTGTNHPEHWVGELASPNLHAIVILFARDVAERERCRQEHKKYVRECEGVELLSSLDLERDSTVRLRSRTLRLPRSTISALH